MNSRDKLTEFLACLYYLIFEWLWEYFWIYLCFNFICIREIIQVPTGDNCSDDYDSVSNELKTVSDTN